MYNINSKEPKIDPCGTPNTKSIRCDRFLIRFLKLSPLLWNAKLTQTQITEDITNTTIERNESVIVLID